jgi:hypothetical protein
MLRGWVSILFAAQLRAATYSQLLEHLDLAILLYGAQDCSPFGKIARLRLCSDEKSAKICFLKHSFCPPAAGHYHTCRRELLRISAGCLQITSTFYRHSRMGHETPFPSRICIRTVQGICSRMSAGK